MLTSGFSGFTTTHGWRAPVLSIQKRLTSLSRRLWENNRGFGASAVRGGVRALPDLRLALVPWSASVATEYVSRLSFQAPSSVWSRRALAFVPNSRPLMGSFEGSRNRSSAFPREIAARAIKGGLASPQGRIDGDEFPVVTGEIVAVPEALAIGEPVGASTRASADGHTPPGPAACVGRGQGEKEGHGEQKPGGANAWPVREKKGRLRESTRRVSTPTRKVGEVHR